MPSPALQRLLARPIAHRGLHDGNLKRMENSRSAFHAAIEGHFGIELDVQLSADGEAVVFHDADLMRLTGQTGLVIEQSVQQLGSYQLGATGDVIEPLGDVLAMIDNRVPVVIEMKDNGSHNHRLADAVARAVCAYQGDSAIMSFSQELVRQFVIQNTGVPVGLTAEGISKAAMEAHRRALDFPVDFVSYQVAALPNAFCTEVKARGLGLITWTVRTPEQAALSYAFGDQITFEGFDPDEYV